jgi:hypothetical protein
MGVRPLMATGTLDTEVLPSFVDGWLLIFKRSSH